MPPEPSETGLPHVVIVGGGISGLAAAERLAASHAVRVTLLDASERLGGIIRTERVDDFLIEHGADVMVAAKPAGKRLAERVGLGARLQGTAIRGGYVFRRGTLRRLPEGLSGLLPTRLRPLLTSGLLSPLGVARLALEPWRPRSDAPDESIASFITRRLGREAYERICEPLLAGIYSGAGARLSMEATFPQLRAKERAHGSLLRGPRPAPSSGPPFLTFPGGLQELIDALGATLAAAPNVTVRLASAVSAVREGQVDLANGETIVCDAVIVATPAPIAARLLVDVDAPLAAELGAIEHGTTSTISLGYDASQVPRALDATGYVVPRAEGRPVLACTWVSSKHHGRAPHGRALFRVFVTGAQHADDDLVALARAEVQASLGVSAAPSLVHVVRWTGAMPQYHLGHPERVRRIEAREAAVVWLAIAGNAYRGVGVPDCIASGERAAARTLEAVARTVPGSVVYSEP